MINNYKLISHNSALERQSYKWSSLYGLRYILSTKKFLKLPDSSSTMNSQQWHSYLLILQQTKPSRTNAANPSSPPRGQGSSKIRLQKEWEATPKYTDDQPPRFLNKVKDQRRRTEQPVHQCCNTALSHRRKIRNRHYLLLPGPGLTFTSG